jgi:glyoxylase-like metal-dependent hydrolase (beta-lactamase superfamily II)
METFLFSSVEGNGQALDGGAMFGNVPRALWSRWEAPDSHGRIYLACRTLLIETEGVKILCETGIGAFFEPKLAKRYGVQNSNRHELLKNLAVLDIKEEEIDYVILSHLHFDHAGGLLPSYQEQKKEKKDLCFPNAYYVVGKKAFQRACQPHLRDKASFIPGLTEKLKQSDRLILVEGDKIPNVLEKYLSFIFTDGHTPGQMHVLFRSQTGERIFFAGDLIPGRAWVHLPVTMGYDRWPEKLIEEKQSLYKKAEKEKWLLFFTHDQNIACARIRKNEKARYEIYDEKKYLKRNIL